MMDYDIDINIPITIRRDGAIISLTATSSAISDETLSMIFKDLDKYIEEKGYATEVISHRSK